MGEFLEPKNWKNYIVIQHVERYKFALKKIRKIQKTMNFKNLLILDIACGSGYGSKMLESIANVIGVDYDMEALSKAKLDYGIKNLVKGDALLLPFKDKVFDIVVSFETIEHVYDGERFIKEMKRVLKEGGIFICSTPNIKYTSHPPFHKKEYTPEEFFTLLKKHFSKVEMFGQYITLKDRISDLFNWKVKSKIRKIVKVIQKNKCVYITKEYVQKCIKINKSIKNKYKSNIIKKIHSDCDYLINTNKYSVVNLPDLSKKRTKLLRIMVGVCVK